MKSQSWVSSRIALVWIGLAFFYWILKDKELTHWFAVCAMYSFLISEIQQIKEKL